MTQPDAPKAEAINRLHTNCDVDTTATAQHHTLGIGQNNASPGGHTHDGKTSKKIGKGKDLAFPITANAAYSQAQTQSIINALRAAGWGT